MDGSRMLFLTFISIRLLRSSISSRFALQSFHVRVSHGHEDAARGVSHVDGRKCRCRRSAPHLESAKHNHRGRAAPSGLHGLFNVS